MVCFPCLGLPARNLSYLWVHGSEKLNALRQQMHALLPSLLSLGLSNCPEIEPFRKGGLASKLSRTARNRGFKHSFSHTPCTGRWRRGGVVSRGWAATLQYSYMALHRKIPNLKALNNIGLQLLGSLKRCGFQIALSLYACRKRGFPFPPLLLKLWTVHCWNLIATRRKAKTGLRLLTTLL